MCIFFIAVFIRENSVHVGLVSKKKNIGSLVFVIVICSIEIEVPFIIKCFGPSVKIVPIMVSKIPSQLKKEYAEYCINTTE